MCYLNWLGHPTRHFNVGAYRRMQRADLNFQDADVFDPNDPSSPEARVRTLAAALENVGRRLSSGDAQVAVIEAINSMVARRKELAGRFQGCYEYAFVESVCNDEDVLVRNYRMKMLYSPDYKDMPREDALRDFLRRIERYEAAYETITERSLHFIRLIDAVTGRRHMDVNRISGYLPEKMAVYLMRVCLSISRSRRACGCWETMLAAFGDFSRSSNGPVKGRVRVPARLTHVRRMRRKHGLAAVFTQEFSTSRDLRAQTRAKSLEVRRGDPGPARPAALHNLHVPLALGPQRCPQHPDRRFLRGPSETARLPTTAPRRSGGGRGRGRRRCGSTTTLGCPCRRPPAARLPGAASRIGSSAADAHASVPQLFAVPLARAFAA